MHADSDSYPRPSAVIRGPLLFAPFVVAPHSLARHEIRAAVANELDDIRAVQQEKPEK